MHDRIPNTGWVPDVLPDFTRSDFRIKIDDPKMLKELREFASKVQSTPLDFIRNSIKLGLIAEKPDATITEEDDDSHVEVLNLNPTISTPPMPKLLKNVIRRYFPKVSLSVGDENETLIIIPGKLFDEIALIANKHNAKIDDIFSLMIALALRVGNGQYSGNKSYYFNSAEGTKSKIANIWE